MKQSNLMAKIARAPYILWACIFIIVPLLIVVYYAFTDSNGAFTLANLGELTQYKETFALSLWYSLLATLITLLVSYPFAFFMSRKGPMAQRMMVLLIMLPMWMNLLIRTYSWMNILERNGIINNLLAFLGIEPLTMIGTGGAVILGMIYNYLPYMILPIYTVMSKIDPFLLEAAEDLGANGWAKLRRVILPLSKPGVISGIAMVFVPSISTFYISQKLGGGKIMLIGDVIERQIQTAYNYNLGAAISLILMILVLLSMAVVNRWAGKDEEGGVIF
ncbi:MAG: ABC transporter permease [Bacillota bacterium]|nr:ABC transporter permease [Bacillota bacterium]